MEKMVLSLFLGCFFYPILFILAGNNDMNESLQVFEFLPDPNTELAALECLKKPHRLIMGKLVLTRFLTYS